MKNTIRSAFVLCALAAAQTLGAQGIYFGLRGGAATPTGAFSESTTGSSTALDAAKSGFGYGAEAGLGFGIVGLYAAFDHINFECESLNCNTDGKYRLQGVTGGLKLGIPGMNRVRPFIKGGVTYNELQGGYGANNQKLTTDKNPGYEVGVGLDVSLLGLLNFTPQLRYIGQNFKYDIPGVVNNAAQPEQGVNYFTFDLGLSVHNPLTGMGRMRR